MSSQPSPPPPSRTPVLTALVVLLVLAAGGLLAAYPRMLHFSFAFSAYDVGMHLQALWKFSRQADYHNYEGLNHHDRPDHDDQLAHRQLVSRPPGRS